MFSLIDGKFQMTEFFFGTIEYINEKNIVIVTYSYQINNRMVEEKTPPMVPAKIALQLSGLKRRIFLDRKLSLTSQAAPSS